MQKAYLMKLFELAQKDKNVLLLLADSGTSYDELFKQELPEQILDFGIAEENTVAAAAGLASCNKIPYVFTAGAFLAYRSMEFIRDDVCLQKKNVKFVGMGSGLGWSTLGPTHHTTEDTGVLKLMPGLVTLCPSTPIMASKCVELAYNTNAPVYIKLGMGGEPEFYDDGFDIEVGKSKVVREGSGISVFVSGPVLAEVLKAQDILEDFGIDAEIIDCYSVSPFDSEAVIKAAQSGNRIVTVEEHTVYGGIGSTVADILVDNGLNAKLLRIGIENGFAVGYGTYDEVRKQNGLDAESIASKIKGWLGK